MAVGLAVLIAFIITSRVEVTSEVLTRTWLLGSSSIAIADVTQLVWGGARGQTFLTIRAPNNWLMLSSLTYGDKALREIEGLLRAAGVPPNNRCRGP